MKTSFRLITTLLLAPLAALSAAEATAPATPRKQFVPDQIWPDNNGVHINAHGGGVMLHDGTYYWFGQHMIAGKEGNEAHVGVHCYSSTDLYNWKDEGIALKVSDDPKSDIAKGCILERPKVIYNAATRKFVMWFHLELKSMGYKAARSGVAVADRPIGPYTFLRSLRPDAGAWPVNVTEAQKSGLKEAEKLIGGQSTCILPVQGRPGAFIAMFDVWRPEDAITGGHIWLPMEFKNDRFTITWRDAWNLNVFEKATPIK